VAGRPAERGRGLARLDVVDRGRAPERHVEVRVGVDETRQEVLAACVDDLVGGDIERLADQRHRLVLDVHIGDVVVGRGDDPAALDQYRHPGPPLAMSPSLEENEASREGGLVRVHLVTVTR
jgi:hypothetical protein